MPDGTATSEQDDIVTSWGRGVAPLLGLCSIPLVFVFIHCMHRYGLGVMLAPILFFVLAPFLLLFIIRQQKVRSILTLIGSSLFALTLGPVILCTILYFNEPADCRHDQQYLVDDIRQYVISHGRFPNGLRELTSTRALPRRHIHCMVGGYHGYNYHLNGLDLRALRRRDTLILTIDCNNPEAYVLDVQGVAATRHRRQFCIATFCNWKSGRVYLREGKLVNERGVAVRFLP